MMLGVGEIVVVLAVALMVLGPKKMPEMMRQVARFVNQLRRMADEVKGQVDEALNASDRPALSERPKAPLGAPPTPPKGAGAPPAAPPPEEPNGLGR